MKRMRLEVELEYDPDLLCEDEDRAETEQMIINRDLSLDDIGHWTVKRIISWDDGGAYLRPQDGWTSTPRDGYPDFYIGWCRQHENLGCYECGRKLIVGDSITE